MVARFNKFSITTTIASVAHTFYFLAPPDHYQDGLTTLAGVTDVANDDDLKNMPVTKVEELLKSPIATRKCMRVKKTNGRNAYVKIIVASDKSTSFDAGVVGKTGYKGGTIEAVIEPLDASFY